MFWFEQTLLSCIAPQSMKRALFFFSKWGQVHAGTFLHYPTVIIKIDMISDLCFYSVSTKIIDCWFCMSKTTFAFISAWRRKSKLLHPLVIPESIELKMLSACFPSFLSFDNLHKVMAKLSDGWTIINRLWVHFVEYLQWCNVNSIG